VGGIAVIAAIVFALLFCRRKKSPSQRVTEIDLDDSPFRLEETFTTFSPPPAHYSSHFPSSQFVQPFADPNLSTTSFPTVHTHDRSVSSLHPSFSSTHTHATTSALIPRSNVLQESSIPFTEVNSMSPSETNAPSNSSQVYATGPFIHAESQFSGSFLAPSGKELTEEQAIFINNLRNSDVPPAEIAHLMDVMRREREEGLGAGIGRIRPGFDVDHDVPPRYDFKSSV
jgi:hypothetical protein